MNDIEAVVALPEMDGGSAELKNQVYEMTDTKANPAKTQPVAGAPPPTEIPAGCALVAADTGSVVSEVSPKVEAEVKAAEAEAVEAAAAEVEALEAALATAKAKAKAAAEAKANPNQAKVAAMLAKAEAAKDKAAKVKASGKANNIASINAASMLAQICERNFMEHQLAARHFKFFHFCEHMRPFSVCVCVCP